MPGKLICQDFDNAFVNGHMHASLYKATIEAWRQNESAAFFANPDLTEVNLTEEAILTRAKDDPIRVVYDEIVENFKKDIKAKAQLEQAFKKALENDNSIAITSFSYYPQAVKRIVNELVLTPYSPDQIHIVTGFPTDDEQPSTEFMFQKVLDNKVGWERVAKGNPMHPDRKNQHMELAMQLVGMDIFNDKQRVILLDDSTINTAHAAQSGYIAIDVDPKNRDAISHVEALNQFLDETLVLQQGQGRRFQIYEHLKFKPQSRYFVNNLDEAAMYALLDGEPAQTQVQSDAHLAEDSNEARTAGPTASSKQFLSNAFQGLKTSSGLSEETLAQGKKRTGLKDSKKPHNS